MQTDKAQYDQFVKDKVENDGNNDTPTKKAYEEANNRASTYEKKCQRIEDELGRLRKKMQNYIDSQVRFQEYINDMENQMQELIDQNQELQLINDQLSG